jgi:hypothetical protein
MYNAMYNFARWRASKMGRMVRKQIYIEPRQEVLLKQLAEARGVSEAELIRRAIDRQVGGGVQRPLPPDPVAWEQAYQFMLDLRTRGPAEGEQRSWRREELYEERMKRYERDPR